MQESSPHINVLTENYMHLSSDKTLYITSVSINYFSKMAMYLCMYI